MSKSMKGFGRAGLSALATSTLVIGACVAGAGAANADSTFQFTRVGGQDRYEVSANVADMYGKADHVILASGEQGKYADSLAANYLSGAINAPILLTQLNTTPDVIKAELQKLGATKVTIVGGPLSVSQAQQDSLAQSYSVDRIEGHTRYDVDAAVIKAAAKTNDTAIVATGEKFPDALAAGPLAYAKNMPIGLVTLANAPQQVIDALKAQGVTKAIVLGGDLSISQETRQQLENNGIHIVAALNGANRASVATMLADYEIKNYGFKNDHVNVATGREFSQGADALSAGPLTGKQNRPLLITAGDPKVGTTQAIGQDLLNWLQANAKTLTGTDNDLFGGPLSITDAMKTAMEKAAQTTTSNQTYSLTPAGNQSVETGKVVQYTVSGLGTSPVDIQLFNCDNVKTGSNGQTTFTGTNPGGTGNYAKAGSTNGSITVVDGTPTGGTNAANGVTPNNGSITFSVTDNSAGDCVVPVVFQQGTGTNADSLPLNADNTPSTPFGTAGQTTFVTYAQNGTFSPVTVKSENGTTFTDTNNNTYKYSSTDVYQLVKSTGGNATTVPDTYADFQQRLSQGDTVSGYYNSPNQSTFVLNDVSPEPGAVTATGSGANSGGVDLTIAPSSATDVTSYNIYRATATPSSSAVNAPLTCPANPGTPGQSPQVAPSTSSAWTKVGSVASTAKTDTNGNYTYTDATPAPATGTAPQYCYLVSAVGPNAAGTSQEGTGVAADKNATGGVTPSKASAATSAPKFADATADAPTGSTTSVTAIYNQPIDTNSVDAGDFKVTYTVNGGPTNSDTVVSAVGNNTGAGGVGQAVITVANAIPAGAVVTITSQQSGTDSNTVGNKATPEQYQAAGETVQATAKDATSPTIASAKAVQGATSATVTMSEPIQCSTLSDTAYQVNYTPTGGAATPYPVTVSGCSGTADNTFTVTFNGPGAFDFTTGTFQLAATSTNNVKDVAGNNESKTDKAAITVA